MSLSASTNANTDLSIHRAVARAISSALSFPGQHPAATVYAGMPLPSTSFPPQHPYANAVATMPPPSPSFQTQYPGATGAATMTPQGASFPLQNPYANGVIGLPPAGTSFPAQYPCANGSSAIVATSAVPSAAVGALPVAGLGARPSAGAGQPPSPPQRLTEGMPDPTTIETQKAAYHSNLESEMSKAEELLVKQQKDQTEYIRQAAEVQKKQMMNQIEQQAKEQELILSQKYSQQISSLHEQCVKQKILLEKQANELSHEFNVRKLQEELMQREYQKQQAQFEEKAKQGMELHRHQRNEKLRQQPERWQYNPHVKVPIDIRAQPDVNGQRTPQTLKPGEHFLVCQEQEGADGILYLRLADGRGWVFDRKPDTGVMCVRQDGPLISSTPMVPVGSPSPSAGLQNQASTASFPAQFSALDTTMAHFHMQQQQQQQQQQQLLLLQQQQLQQQQQQMLMGGAFGAQAPAGPLVPPGAASRWLYQPEVTALMDVRAEPDVNAPRTPHVLSPGDAFGVSEELKGEDGVLYLKLADGRGWAFDRKPDVGVMCVRQPSAPPPGPLSLPAIGAPMPMQGQVLQPASPGLAVVYAPAAPGATIAMPSQGATLDGAAAAGARMTSQSPRATAVAGFAGITACEAAPATSHWMYAPEVLAPIDTRAGPDIESQRLSHRLNPGETFEVCEERESGGVLFLKLADGRGWLFDRKPGVGGMCVRQPRPAYAGLLSRPSGSVAVAPVMLPSNTAAVQQTMGYAPVLPVPAPQTSCAGYATGSVSFPVTVQQPVVAPGPPVQTGVLSGGPMAYAARTGSVAASSSRGGSVALPTRGGSVAVPARGGSVVMPTQYVGPATQAPAPGTVPFAMAGSAAIPSTQYVGPASAFPTPSGMVATV